MATFKRATGIASLSEKRVTVVLTDAEYKEFAKVNKINLGNEPKSFGMQFDNLSLNMEVAMNGAEETTNGEAIVAGSRGWFVPQNIETGEDIPGIVIRMNIVSSDDERAGKNIVYDGGEGNLTVQRTTPNVQQTTARNNPAGVADHAEETEEAYTEESLQAMNLKQLREVADNEGIDHTGLKKTDLVANLIAELV
ncbi:hypothetical protein [Mesotoga prima]|uniref:hypothetical protein n=1 Tax=Mesotoga prima TaxID=1184387 RepID=UPI002FD9CA85